MNMLPVGPRRVVAWLIVGMAWAVLLALGVCCALALPLNLLLIPCWLSAASSVGPLARELLDAPPLTPTSPAARDHAARDHAVLAEA